MQAAMQAGAGWRNNVLSAWRQFYPFYYEVIPLSQMHGFVLDSRH
ncbi:hypothetical protein [Xenorhabdus szentirmaii]|nr:hypothetical protein [Xenorhabdus sp. ZM]